MGSDDKKLTDEQLQEARELVKELQALLSPSAIAQKDARWVWQDARTLSAKLVGALVTDETEAKKDTYDRARGTICAEYQKTVARCAEDFERRLMEHEWDDENSFRESVDQDLDGALVYYTDQYEAIYASNNSNELLDEAMGEYGATADNLLGVWAFCCLRADVNEKLGDVSQYFECSECSGDLSGTNLQAGDWNKYTSGFVCDECRESYASECPYLDCSEMLLKEQEVSACPTCHKSVVWEDGEPYEIGHEPSKDSDADLGVLDDSEGG